MRVEKIGLIRKEYITDSIGQHKAEETVKEVFGEFFSISSNEFANAGQLGLKPDYRIKVWAYEYNDEDEVFVNGERYKVYRSYIDRSGKSELYVEKIK